MRVEVQVDLGEANALFDRLIKAGLNPAPFLRAAGEYGVDSTRERFRISRAPDGSPWAPNSLVTIQRYGSRFSSGRSKKPLIGETRALSTTIFYRFVGSNAVEIGSPMEYAAVHQFGAAKGSFGATSRGAPIPWGNIPARPFWGLSDKDRKELEALLVDYLEDNSA